MSWNEPGRNKKDPWSGRDRQSGPPDLDEVIRSIQEKLNKLFGGRPAGRGKPSSPLKGIALLLIAVLIIWGLSGIYIVQEGHRGVVTRFGKYTETTLPGPHWHLPTPIERVEKVNIENIGTIELGYRSGGRQEPLGSVPREALMLTKDENIVDVRLAVQYQITGAKNFLFNVTDPLATLKQVTESALRAVVGNSRMDFVLTEGRSEVVARTKKDIQQIMDEYGTGIFVTSVNLVDAQPPDEVQDAFEDAIKAREDEQRFKNEAEKYANRVIPKARGAAARLVEEAEAHRQRVIARANGEASRFGQLLTEYELAPEVTRKRLYLDAIESVLSQTDTVMVDVKGGNNLLYLPLDRLRSFSGSTESMQSSKDIASDEKGAMKDGMVGLRTSNRGRESRGR